MSSVIFDGLGVMLFHEFVPADARVLPISKNEFVRHGAATKAPTVVLDLWDRFGAFDVPARCDGRGLVGAAYGFLDPYTVKEILDPASPLFRDIRKGYPFASYDNKFIFCIDAEEGVRFHYDDDIVFSGGMAFLRALSADIFVVEKLKDEERLRRDPNALTDGAVREIARSVIGQLEPTGMNDMGRIVKAVSSQVDFGERGFVAREIIEDELCASLAGNATTSGFTTP